MKTMTFINKFFQYSSITFLAFFMSCNDIGLSTPTNNVQFESEKVGMLAEENELTIKINFDREADASDTVILSVVSNTLKYGVDFTTDPATEDEKLQLPFSENASSVSFRVLRGENVYPRDEDKITFQILSVTGPLALGKIGKLTLSFGEITAEKATMEPNTGGPSEPNIVFVDLSASRQESVSRDAWDLGFYNVEGEFRVILNPTSAMMARRLDSSDLTTVTAADTIGFGSDMAMDYLTVDSKSDDEDWQKEAKNWIDDPTGDLTKTAISEVSATGVENKVYIINRGLDPEGNPRGWKKIRILRNGTGYLLQYADIGETTFKVVRVDRNADYLFSYASFDKGNLAVEPKKEYWDIAFTVFSKTTAFGSPGSPLVPYQFKDIVVQNRYRVETAEVLNDGDDSAYANFDETDLTDKDGMDAIEYSTSQINIGSTWRNGGGSGSSPSLKTDRFYVVKDVQGNIYKLRFTAMTKDGERGHPGIEYELVKKAGS